MAKSPKPSLTIETLTHDEATRKNIPTAEYQAVMRQDEQQPVRVAYPRQAAGLEDEKRRRNPDLDPQLIWRGKDRQDWSSLVVQAPPLYIQEKVHPKVLIDDLRRFQARNPAPGAAEQEDGQQIDLFADFNGLPDANAKTEFYQHDAHWANRMILGDSLQVMASLAEREGLRGQVQWHLLRSALRHQIQQQLPVVHHQPRCEGRQYRPHHPRAGTGQGVSRHLEGRDSFHAPERFALEQISELPCLRGAQ